MNGLTENLLKSFLDKNEICYYSLIFSECYNGVISISFLSKYDMDLFLDLVKYKSKFNKSGFIIIPETSVIIVTGGEAYEIIRTAGRVGDSSIS
jgi:hypothetical protein